jgi:hypothetical protein
VPMEAYLDESGIHRGAKRCVIGGFSGGRRKCESFEKKWLAILEKFDIPEAIGFHSKDFFKKGKDDRRSGIYRNWSMDQSFDFLDDVLGAIKSHKLHPFGIAVSVDEFNALPPNFRRWITGGRYDEIRGKWLTSGAPSKPWFFAFNHSLISGCRKATDGVKVDFIFDRQQNFSPFAIQLWNELKGDVRFDAGLRMGGIAFYSRFERVCLQASDLIAYCLYYVEEYRADAKKTDVRYCISKLVNSGMIAIDLNGAIEPLLKVYPEQLRLEDDAGVDINK